MSQLEVPQKIVVCRNGTRFYVNAEQAVLIEQQLMTPNRPAYLRIDGCLVATGEISLLATPQKIDELDKQRRGLWQCAHGNWQAKGEIQCKCNWGKPSVAKQEERPKPTPEQIERGELLREIMSKKVIPLRDLKNLREVSNDSLREIIKTKRLKKNENNNTRESNIPKESEKSSLQ